MEKTADYLAEALKPEGNIIILGGKQAVSEDAELVLSDQYHISWIVGMDRYETNLEMVRYSVKSSDEDLLVCTYINGLLPAVLRI